MKIEQKTLRIGAAVILFACALRFLSSGMARDMTALFLDPSLSSILLYAGTGRVSVSPPPETDVPQSTTLPPQTSSPPAFTAEDAALVPVTNYPGGSIDIPAMLVAPLRWDLTAPEPTVLILHSHTCESYENTEGYIPSGSYRTRDENYNMVSIGKHLAQCLESRGIGVIHDTTVHDYPSYNDAYKLSRETAQRYLEQYPTICLVLDIHRDAYEDSSGKQLSSTVSIDGVTSSKLMIVAGTNGYDEGHPHWRENLSVAVKLHAVLEKSYPGLCRSLAIRSSAFNQDLSPGALLIEVGTAGDTRQQALAAAEFLADGIAQLALGSQ